MKTSNEVSVVEPKALGGGLEGAERTTRETFQWQAAIISPDDQIGPVKDQGDARARDMVQNDGFAAGALSIHRDSIVGAQFRLNAQPKWTAIPGATEEWAEEFQEAVENRFNLLSDSNKNWLDAQRMNTLTGLVRLAIGQFFMTGEVLGTCEWIRELDRPWCSALQLINPSRLSNPDGMMDTKYLRRGVRKNMYGRATAYCIQVSHPNSMYIQDFSSLSWNEVPAEKPWGRRQVVHILEQLQPDQSRGISEMVSVLKNMKMTKSFQDVVLQNAVVNASYAAAIESELPSSDVYAALGLGQKSFTDMLGNYMSALQQYSGGASNIAVDGVKIPHLFPNTKLSLKPMGTPGGVGTDFEQALLRHTAAALGLSYEQFSRDYTKTNYSSARASANETWKYMQGRKKVVADRLANELYALVVEEDLNSGLLKLPKGYGVADFYSNPQFREALLNCTWIGASRGQIDELKETQSAVMRIQNNLSTDEEELGRLGKDWREVYHQRAREKKLAKKLGIEIVANAKEPGANDAKKTMDDSGTTNEDED